MQRLVSHIKTKWQQWDSSWISLLLALFGLAAMVSYAEQHYKETTASDVEVDIQHQAGFKLVETSDVRHELQQYLPASLQQYRLSNIPLKEFEGLLEDRPFVEEAEVYTGIDGQVEIKVDQREPLLRVINSDQKSFYLDQQGRRMPFSPSYKQPVITASGHIEAGPTDSLTKAQNQHLQSLYKVSQYISKDSFLSALTGQLFITQEKEIQLIPRLGEQTIVLGEARNLPSRFAKLKAFYRKVLPYEGWYRYNKINLKYKKQIVAKK